MSPQFWFLTAGSIGAATPWMLHLAFESDLNVESWYPFTVIIYFGAIFASMIAFFGSPFFFSRLKGKDWHLGIAMFLGGIGLISSVFVFGLSMM